MIEVLARSAWTSWKPKLGLVPLIRPAGFAVHWPGTSISVLSHAKSAVAAELRGELDYHVNGHGWTDIAYQMAVDNAGRIWDLRGVKYRSAANGNVWTNTRYGAITCLLGKDEVPSPEMISAVRYFRNKIWLARYPKATKVVGHRDLKQTACPGDRLYALVHDGTFLKPSAPEPAPVPVEEYDVATKVVRVSDPKTKKAKGYYVVWPGATDLLAKAIPGPYPDAEDEIKVFGDGGPVLNATPAQFAKLYKVVED